MFKLTVVGGPAKGKSYQLREGGETSIGRVDGNDVVLTSQKVSKKHCVLVVNNTGVTVKDAGSSNGTFVNGILTKLKIIKAGDRVSVGEFVLELVKIEAPKQLVPAGGGNVVSINGGIPMPGAMPGTPSAPLPPQNLQEKAKFLFEKYILNFVYNQNEKHEWQVMMAGMFAFLTVAGAVLGVYPIVDRVDDKLVDEAVGRAFVLARQMVDRNGSFLFEHQESRMDISFILHEPNVQAAFIVDMDQRILAPGSLVGQNIGNGQEAVFAAAVAKFFSNPRHEQSSQYFAMAGDTIQVAVPLRIFSSSTGKNVTVAAGLIYFDKSMIVFDSGTESLMYIEAILLSGIVAVLTFFALYRLTMRPLINLNEQIDTVLKGGASAVEKKYKMEEINPLIDIVNTALQRATKGGGGAEMSSGGGGAAEETLEAMKFAAARFATGTGMMIFSGDKKIVLWSPYIEEITGIRADQAVGQDIGAVARDAAFSAFMEDFFAKSPFFGSEPLVEDFEFSGNAYRMEVLAAGTPGSVKYWFITAVKPA